MKNIVILRNPSTVIVGVSKKEVKSLQEKCLNQVRGYYQRNLVLGGESWSGSSLRGTARSYGYHYGVSRDNLFARLCKVSKHTVSILDRDDHNRRKVVIFSQRAYERAHTLFGLIEN